METKKRIIAVDDSHIILRMLESLLGERYEFKGFINGRRALEYLKTEVPNLIILDIEMPEIDGFEVLRMIRSKVELQLIPVLILTSNDDKAHVQTAFKAGAEDYCIKPLNEKIIMKKIHTLLGEPTELTWDDI